MGRRLWGPHSLLHAVQLLRCRIGVQAARALTCVVVSELCRGQSIKVFSQILRKARSKRLVVPNIKVRRALPPLLRTPA
jgi:hypothetical protein